MSGSNRSIFIPSLITAIGYIVVQLDVTIVNVAIPTLKESFGADVGSLQWIPDAYVITYASLLLISGSLCDRFGSRNMHLLGLIIFGLSSVICAFSSDLVTMVVGRIIQGVGAAIILPSSLALLTSESNMDPIAKNKAIGWWSAIGGIVSAAGPFFGGLVIKYYSWNVIFLINIPICIVGFFAVLAYFKNNNRSKENAVDYKGGLFVALACFALVYFLSIVGKVMGRTNT